jgi:cation diffusion facilitator family transporter
MHKTSGTRDLGAAGLAELLLAVFTGSAGLLGDAIHNLSDVSTSAVVFLGFRLSRRPATECYPYGLERAEDLAGVGIAAVIWASAAFAGYESIRKLIGHGHTSHVGAGIAVISNGDFEEYWRFHLAREHQRLYPGTAQGQYTLRT